MNMKRTYHPSIYNDADIVRAPNLDRICGECANYELDHMDESKRLDWVESSQKLSEVEAFEVRDDPSNACDYCGMAFWRILG